MTPNFPTQTQTVVSAGPSQFSGGAPLDLCALADVYTELQLTHSSDDAWFAALISRESSTAAHYCNRIFQVQTYRDNIAPFRDPYQWQLTGQFIPLQLANWPVTNIPSPAGTAPPVAPVLSQVAVGVLAPATYYAKITYVTPQGETSASLESVLAVAANNLLSISPPGLDSQLIATGWNAYIGTVSFGETKQNAAPISLGASFTLPASGLATGGQPLPNYLSVTENPNNPNPSANLPRPLAEGVDFLVDPAKGQIFRLTASGFSKTFTALPLAVEYSAGYAAIPGDIQDAVIQLVKLKYFARQRDPAMRSESVSGIYDAQYWFGTGPGGAPDMPNYVSAALDRYRVHITA